MSRLALQQAVHRNPADLELVSPGLGKAGVNSGLRRRLQELDNALKTQGCIISLLGADGPEVVLTDEGDALGNRDRHYTDQERARRQPGGVVAQEGVDLTIVTWGAMVYKSIEASKKVDFSVEVLDIRYIYPLDFELIKNSIKKTNRVIVVHEDNITNGFGGEIVSRINEECFEFLDSPVKRIGSKDFPIPYASIFEDEVLVQTDWIVDGINEIGNY